VSPRELPRRSAIAGIRLYQAMLSPYLGRRCRFYPTCSQYAREALEQHGFMRGAWLAIRRLGRCHPFHPGGVDLVPPRDGPVATSKRTISAPDSKES
jgi:uncharacterized protein